MRSRLRSYDPGFTALICSVGIQKTGPSRCWGRLGPCQGIWGWEQMRAANSGGTDKFHSVLVSLLHPGVVRVLPLLS
jgi:hypothetical protein